MERNPVFVKYDCEEYNKCYVKKIKEKIYNN